MKIAQAHVMYVVIDHMVRVKVWCGEINISGPHVYGNVLCTISMKRILSKRILSRGTVVWPLGPVGCCHVSSTKLLESQGLSVSFKFWDV